MEWPHRHIATPPPWRELCSFLSWEISRKEHLCARFFASPRILRRRRAINHKSVTARGKLLESLFPAFSLFGRERARVPPLTSSRSPTLPPSLFARLIFLLLFSSPSARKRAATPAFNRYCPNVTVTAQCGAHIAMLLSPGSPLHLRPRDNLEFRITAAIRAIHRVLQSATLAAPSLATLFGALFPCRRVPHDISLFSPLVKCACAPYLADTYLSFCTPTICENLVITRKRNRTLRKFGN